MSKIGILLPGSTLYPTIGIDFLQGMKSCLAFYQTNTDVQLLIHPISYGLMENEIYRQVEKWLLSDNVDVVVLYAENRYAAILSPLFSAMGKLLLITNSGAHYPQVKAGISNTIFHSLNDCVYSFLTGRLCNQQNSETQAAVMATSYYDGGYQHCHAMSNSFVMNGGEIKFNYVTDIKKESFNLSNLADFLKGDLSVNNMLCLYCGDLARNFFEQVAPLQKDLELNLYGSPMMFDITPGDFNEVQADMPDICGYTGWIPSIDSPENNEFCNYFYHHNNRHANLFSLQGWETAQILIAYLTNGDGYMNVSAAINKIKNNSVTSPRGKLHFSDNNNVLGPAYLVKHCGHNEISITSVIDDIEQPFQEMIGQIPDTMFSTWQNTYLCI